MSTVVAGAVLYVADLERMRAFYESVVGLEPSEESPTYVALERGGFQLVLLTTRTAQAHRRAHGEDDLRDGVPVKLVHVVDDLAKAASQVAAAGCALKGGEWSFGDHRVQDAVDPEGNVLQLRARR